MMLDTDEVIYDPDKHILRFHARAGDEAIPCGVSRAALVALEDDALAGPHAMKITYRRNRQRIQAAALRKYRARRLEADEVVVVWRDDITPAPA